MEEKTENGCPGIYVVPFGQYSLRREGSFMLPYNF
jgi:hypothetical protein